MSFTIDLEKNPEENVKELMQERLDACRTALQDVSQPHTAIHKARKEFKKLRALCRLVRDEAGQKAYKTANYFFRNTARKISDARDATAVLETLRDLEQKLTGKKEQAELKKIKNHLAAKKAAVTRIQIHQHGLLQEVLEDLKGAEQYFDAWSFQNNDFAAFQNSVKRVYSRCKKEMATAYKIRTPLAFHEWRKRAKYLRYQMDLLTPLWPKPLSVLENELHTLTDYLGNEHDLTVFADKVEQMMNRSHCGLEDFMLKLEPIRKGLQKQAYPLGQKLFYLKASQFAGLLASCWDHSTAPDLTEKEKEAIA